MDSKTIEVIALLQTIASDAVYYEVFQTKKRGAPFHLVDAVVDIATDVLPSSFTNAVDTKTMYLVATEEKGTFVAIEDGRITQMIEIPTWKKEMKEEFKEIIVDSFIYKIYRKLN